MQGREKQKLVKSGKKAAKKRIKSLPKASSALQAAAIDDNEAEAKRLIAAGENPDSVFNGITMMGVATTHGAAKVAKVLLDAGVDPNAACNQYGSVPLMNAARTSKVSPALIKLLLAAGADVNKVVDLGRWGKSTLLVEAVRGENLGAVKMLVQAKADLKATAKGGISPLHVAATREYANTKSYAGTARYNNISEIVRYLAKAGMNVEARTDDDETPLMLAAMYGCGGVIDALVECGAKVNARTKSGKTALTLAKSQRTDSDTSGAVKALIKHGGTM